MTSSPSASKQTYDIYLNTRATGLIKAANCVIAGFQYQQLPPSPAEAAKLNKIFGLPKPRVEACAMAVTNAVAQWDEIASSCGINEADAHKIGTFFIGNGN